jgi:hypothetical protein
MFLNIVINKSFKPQHCKQQQEKYYFYNLRGLKLLFFTMLRIKALVLYNVEDYRNNISFVAVRSAEV